MDKFCNEPEGFLHPVWTHTSCCVMCSSSVMATGEGAACVCVREGGSCPEACWCLSCVAHRATVCGKYDGRMTSHRNLQEMLTKCQKITSRRCGVIIHTVTSPCDLWLEDDTHCCVALSSAELVKLNNNVVIIHPINLMNTPAYTHTKIFCLHTQIPQELLPHSTSSDSHSRFKSHRDQLIRSSTNTVVCFLMLYRKSSCYTLHTNRHTHTKNLTPGWNIFGICQKHLRLQFSICRWIMSADF